MRQYYASDKKKREEKKRRQKEEKRLKRLSQKAAKKAVDNSVSNTWVSADLRERTSESTHTLDFLAGDQRTNIRMSKVARMLQSAAVKTNWEEMVKLLFRADPYSGRNDEIQRIFSHQAKSKMSSPTSASYGIDQLQYILFLMLIISVAEKQTQELYGHDYAARCEEISRKYGLKDDQYWPSGEVPEEWEKLNKEFEENSLQLLVKTLKNYHQDEIATLVESGGLEQLFAIIKNIKLQFLTMLSSSTTAIPHWVSGESGSIPETVQSAKPNDSHSI